MVINVGIAQNAYDRSIYLSKFVKYSSLGMSSWKTKLYAINANRATIEVVNLVSSWELIIGIHSTDQATSKITKTGMIILKVKL